MRSKRSICFFLFIFIISAFFACKKDDSGENPTPPDKVIYEEVLGKWKIATSSGRERLASYKIQDASQLLSIEFLSDTTYIVVAGDKEVLTGKFVPVDSTTIDLSNFGRLSEIKITGGSMNFKLSTDGTTVSISANKAEAMPLTDNTKMLCKNWYITKEEDGADFYFDEMDSATVLFSAAGTYLVQTFLKDTLTGADIANWKWHPQDANVFVYWWDDETAEEGENEVVINELSNNKLKFTESYYDYDYSYDDQQNEIVDSTLVTETFVLIPVSQVSPRNAKAAFRANQSPAYSDKAIKRRLFGVRN